MHTVSFATKFTLKTGLQVIVVNLLVILIFRQIIFLIFIQIIFILIFRSVGGLFFSLFVLHFLLSCFCDCPEIFSVLLGCSRVVRDDEIVEDCSRLDLPQVEPDDTVLRVLGNSLGIFGIVLGVINLRVNPWSLVVGVVNLLGLPFSLIFRVINHGWLPLSVHLIIPILGFGCIRVGDVLGLLPVFRLRVLGVVNLGSINPVIGLLLLGILDHLGWEEVPVVSQRATLSLLIVNEHFVGSIGVEDKGVQVSEHVILTADVLLDQVVLALVLEDDVDLLGAGAADVRTEHHVVGRFSVHVCLL